MRAGIADITSLTFAKAIYMALGHGLSVADSFATAKASVSLAGLPGNRVPIIYEREDGVAAGTILFGA
jgi:hypothetical protein